MESPEDTAKTIIKRYTTMKADKSTLESHLQEIAELVLPRSSYFNVQRSPGQKLMDKVYDSTAIHSNELLASALVGLNMNPSSRWFMANTEGMEDEVKKWLDNAAKVMLSAINSPKSKFYTAHYEYFVENCAFGTSATFITEDEDGDGIHCEARSLTEFVCSQNSRGNIDTIYRRFEWPAHRVFDKWGNKSGKEVIEAMEKKKQDKKFFIIHAIQPRTKRSPKIKTAVNLPISEYYVLEKGSVVLEEGGYNEQAFNVGRFYKSPMETYGRSPATTALPDIKSLQVMMRATIVAAQKSVDPPLIVASGNFMAPLRTIPNGINVFDGSDGRSINDVVSQLPSAHPEIGLDLVSMWQDKIKTIFFVDQLQFAGGPQMTATEVLQRTEEKLRLIGPLQGRVQEYLGAVLDRIFGILYRQGKFGEEPKGMPSSFEFKYTSQVAQAQKQQESNGLLRAIETISPLLQIDPNLLLDNLDGNKTVRDTMEDFGVSSDKMKPEETTSETQELRQQNEQLQQQILTLQEGAKAAQGVKEAQQPAEGG
jgi:hypothetical protein